MGIIQVVAIDPKDQPAADVAQIILDHYGISDKQIRRETVAEFSRQYIYGLPPSKGMPDVRLRCLYLEDN